MSKKTATLLTCIGSAGMLATVIFSVRATPKALELIKKDSRVNHDGDPEAYTIREAFKSAWKCYIPSAVIGLGTIACIFGANSFNKGTQASLASAYAVLDRTIREYKRATTEVFGIDSQQKILERVVQNNKPDTVTQKQLFFDSFANRYFESSLPELYKAEYRINDALDEDEIVTLNEFYNLLGVPEIECGDNIGWSKHAGIKYGYSCVEFELDAVEFDDGLKCYVLIYPYLPTADYKE